MLFLLLVKDNYLSLMYRSILKIIIVSVVFCMGCASKKQISFDEPFSVAREFIDASLRGNYDEAGKYIIRDSVNINSLNTMEEFYKKMLPEEKKGYANANIIINPTENVSDSEMIVNYTNTFKKIPSKLKLKKIKNEWRVDFKYIFSSDK
ncbi:hypothetical protein BH09BAC2_BH09BAC2_17140 [soil metagenome]